MITLTEYTRDGRVGPRHLSWRVRLAQVLRRLIARMDP